MIEVINPTDRAHWLELRTKDITSTESAALFNINPYMSEYELWHKKKNPRVEEIEPNERMKWGNRLQDAIAQGVAEEQSWKLRKKEEYIRDPDLKMGSSFDFEIESPLSALLEIKNVDARAYADGWIAKDDVIEAPPHIELQIQHQLALTDKKETYIGALIGGNKLVLIKRERNDQAIEFLKKKIEMFWQSIRDNNPPAFRMDRDADFIISLYNQSNKGEILNAETDNGLLDLCLQYKDVSEVAKNLEKDKSRIKAEILTKIASAEKVLGKGFTISAGNTAPTVIERYERQGFRNFRINWRKEKV